eukprot:CAMPEP_0205909002 /NCGR_PEP_ID=MMETSP1325-20131115/3589_1 /ASSEMBLY_ACC=CAM_ASM_000708 /TAXON_ID=236786 /ORGANISM="Florenciella sp., Strain RCC1007" /LENGTH=138 /DNA_ID=CAMNT_0053275263 /DNA_START=135 /DNA_END=551 /DNA_ORIENTATION=-
MTRRARAPSERHTSSAASMAITATKLGVNAAAIESSAHPMDRPTECPTLNDSNTRCATDELFKDTNPTHSLSLLLLSSSALPPSLSLPPSLPPSPFPLSLHSSSGIVSNDSRFGVTTIPRQHHAKQQAADRRSTGRAN